MNPLAAGVLAALVPVLGPAGVLPAQDDPLEADLLWWPAQLQPASRLYQCFPAATAASRDSVVVWTDLRGRVMALAPAQTGSELPLHALAMVSHTRAPSGPVRVAARGFTVKATAKRASLRVGRSALVCMASSED